MEINQNNNKARSVFSVQQKANYTSKTKNLKFISNRFGMDPIDVKPWF